MAGAESILQYYFNLLSASIMHPSTVNAIFESSRESGKAWLTAVKEQCDGNQLNEDADTWSIFVRIACVVCSRCESVWRSIKSRIFSKFTPKRFREMPISSLVHMLTLFISFAYTTEICEVSEKTIALIMSVFESSDKDRHEILLHAVHCLILLHRERELDDTRIANSLISMMDKLTEADASGLYAESYLYLAEKGIEVVSLGRFLPHMTSVDIGHILETSAHANRTPGCLWNVAVEKLLTSDFRHSIVFLSAQLRSRCEHSPLLASQGMSAISNTLLSEKSPSTDVALKFLVEFFHSFDSETFFPVESMLPLWFCIAMTHIESDGELRLMSWKSYVKNLQLAQQMTTTAITSGYNK
ncbi:unnamed protein product [Toxocara canis]|uniref:Protein MMS22-like N-terminal domain-containing protein n=1 Tax=Toxocara canis TaxID=6265 RepID=A0A3P7H1Z0_TOXCA|nr:unnamed protein product [Toxocara canis]